MADPLMTIGETARRAGVNTSLLRYYGRIGLLPTQRTAGGQRRYRRSALRRIAFIQAAQQVGLSLDEIGEALAQLPDARVPSRADWRKLSASWKPRLDAEIARLSRMRDTLASCIGCGCLSLDTCAMLNPSDRVQQLGTGPRYLMGDRPRDAGIRQSLSKPTTGRRGQRG